MERSVMKIINIQPSVKNKKLQGVNDKLEMYYPIPKLHFNMLVLAPTGVGKSVFIRNLLLRFYSGTKKEDKVFDNVFMLNPNFYNSGEDLVYDLPDDNIETDLENSDTFLQDIISFQTENKKDFSLLVCDDAQDCFTKKSKIANYLSRSRHNRVSTIVVAQYLKKLPPTTRTNATSMIIFKNQKRADLKLLEEIAPDSHFMEKWEILEEDPSPYSFLFIDFKNPNEKYWLNFEKPI